MIVFFDLEATGLNTQNDRIVQIALCKYNDERKMIDVYKTLVNPLIPINPQASEVHGIYDKDVVDAPKFGDIKEIIIEFIEGCDLGGFNSWAFDMPMLFNEFARNNYDWDWKKHTHIDVGNIFKIKEQRTLGAASLFYLKQELKNAHDALADVECTANVFFAQADKYELGTNMQQIAFMSNYDKTRLDMNGFFSQNENKEIVFNFGKYKGELASNNLDYVEWMYGKDFPSDTRELCEEILIQHERY